MATPNEVRTLIQNAKSVQDFVAADRALRTMENEPEFPDLLAQLNAKSAPQMYAIKDEIDMGTAMQIAREATMLKAAGYPVGGPEFMAWANRIVLAQGSKDDLFIEIVTDPKLSRDEQDKLIRLLEAKKAPLNTMTTYEYGWADLGLTLTGRRVLDRIAERRREVESFRGSDLYEMYKAEVRVARTAKHLRVVREEATSVLPGNEAAMIQAAAKYRRAEMAGEALAKIIDSHGWQVVRALHTQHDITHRLDKDGVVAEFLDLMGEIQEPMVQIRQADEKLADEVVRLAWNRAETRLNEKAAEKVAQDRLRDRLAEIE